MIINSIISLKSTAVLVRVNQTYMYDAIEWWLGDDKIIPLS